MKTVRISSGPKRTQTRRSLASAPALEGRSGGRSRTFFDSNILLYSEDARDPRKKDRALALILEHRQRNTAVVSLQVLQEYFFVATRKLGIDPADARRKVEVFSRFRLVEPSVADVLAAIDLYRLHRLSYWNAMIIHCARIAGCAVVLSEDRQHGQVIAGVRIVNPFV